MLSADTNNNKSSGLYTCQTCNSIFTCLNYYQKHRQQHAETEGVKLLTCLHCTYVSDNGFHYNWHIMSHASSPPHRCDVCDPNSQSTNNDQFLTTSSLTTSTASTATTILSSSSSTNQFKQNVANFSDSNHHHHNNHSSYHHFPNNNGASINGIDQTSITNRISNTIISNDGKCRSISTETDDDLILESQLYSPIPGDESPCPTLSMAKNSSAILKKTIFPLSINRQNHENYDTRQLFDSHLQQPQSDDQDQDDNATIIDESVDDVDDNNDVILDNNNVHCDGENGDYDDEETDEETDVDEEPVLQFQQQQQVCDMNGGISHQNFYGIDDNGDNHMVNEEDEDDEDENDDDGIIHQDQFQLQQPQEFNNGHQDFDIQNHQLMSNGFSDEQHMIVADADNDHLDEEDDDDQQPDLIGFDDADDDEDEEEDEDDEEDGENFGKNNCDIQMPQTQTQQRQQVSADIYDFNSDEDLDQQRPPQLNISSKSFNLSSSNQHQQLSSLSHHHQHHLQPERFLNQAHHLHQHHQSITQGLPTLQINNSNANGNDQQHQTQSIHHNSNAQSSLNQNHPAASFTIAHPNFIFPNAAAATVATGQLLTTGPHSQNNPTAAVASPNAQGAAAIFNPNATFTAANGQMVQLVSLQPFTHHTGDSGQTATQYLQSAQTNSGTPIDTGLPGLSRLPSSVPNKKVHSQLPSTKTSKTQQVSSGLVFAKKTPKSNKSHSSSSSNNNTNLAVSSRNESLSPTELANSLGTTITKIVSPSDYKPMKGKGKGNRKPRISFISVVNGITLGSDGIRRKFHCSHCGNGKSFKTKSHLQRHMLTHTGEKPYQCQECGAKFNQSSSLRNHIIAIHTKRFPHTCTTCGKGFLMPAVLQKHISATGHQSEI